MGYNFTGITIDRNFKENPDDLIEFLGLPLEFEKEIDFESGSGYKDDDYYDIFFSHKGTSIYTFEPLQISPSLSGNCTILSYMVSETSMAFFMSLDVNGERVREVVDHEGEISNNIGDPLDVEKDKHLMESIIKQKEILFGMNFYEMPLKFKGYRYKLAKASIEDEHFNPFYLDGSVASNPGRISVNLFQWTKMNFSKILKNKLILFVSFFLMLKVHWLFGLIFLGFLLYNIWYWFGTFSLFKMGDSNPGKVISINPDKIAVATNMGKLGGNYPILKIVETNLPSFEKKVGNFIPTVALYNDNPHGYPFWAEFHPVPMSHGTSDKSVLKGKFETFSSEDFKRIDKYLSEIESTEEGTYKTEIETSSWKEYPNVIVGSLKNMQGPEKEE